MPDITNKQFFSAKYFSQGGEQIVLATNNRGVDSYQRGGGGGGLTLNWFKIWRHPLIY